MAGVYRACPGEVTSVLNDGSGPLPCSLAKGAAPNCLEWLLLLFPLTSPHAPSTESKWWASPGGVSYKSVEPATLQQLPYLSLDPAYLPAIEGPRQ
jgi:hypothetical protein